MKDLESRRLKRQTKKRNERARLRLRRTIEDIKRDSDGQDGSESAGGNSSSTNRSRRNSFSEYLGLKNKKKSITHKRRKRRQSFDAGRHRSDSEKAMKGLKLSSMSTQTMLLAIGKERTNDGGKGHSGQKRKKSGHHR